MDTRVGVEALTKRPSQGLVGGLGYKFQRGSSISPGDPESGRKKKAGDRKVLPSVECPLAVPGELDGIGEWLEIGDGPLVAVGAAGADEVAQYVQVEADEDQKGGESGVRGRTPVWGLRSANGPAEGAIRRKSRTASALDKRAKCEIRKRSRGSERAGDEVSGKGTDQRKCQRMQRMMVLRKPQQRMRRVPG